LFPHLAGLRVQQVEDTGDVVVIWVADRVHDRPFAGCSYFGGRSLAIAARAVFLNTRITRVRIHEPPTSSSTVRCLDNGLGSVTANA
jgi:hypothetical protein